MATESFIDAKGYPNPPSSNISSYLNNPAPQGTKAWILDLGTLECDAGFVLRGGNSSTKSNPKGPDQADRRRLAMYCLLIEHPTEGLILWETGPGPGETGTENDYEKTWGESAEYFCRVDPKEANELPLAIAKTGHDIKDVKHIVMGHLHLDHAGGLAFFKGRKDVQVWVHEIELKHAYWGIATGAEAGVYLPGYMDLDLSWRTITGSRMDLFAGLTLIHLPGHTPGLMGLQLTLPNDGVFIFTSDHFHLRENYENLHIQGWLARDCEAWYRSTQTIRILHRATNARIIFGHDFETTHSLYEEKEFFT